MSWEFGGWKESCRSTTPFSFYRWENWDQELKLQPKPVNFQAYTHLSAYGPSTHFLRAFLDSKESGCDNPLTATFLLSSPELPCLRSDSPGQPGQGQSHFFRGPQPGGTQLHYSPPWRHRLEKRFLGFSLRRSLSHHFLECKGPEGSANQATRCRIAIPGPGRNLSPPQSTHPSSQPHTLPDVSTFILPHLTIPLPQPCFLPSTIKLWLPPPWTGPAFPPSVLPASIWSNLREAGEEGETQAHLLLPTEAAP